MKLLSTIIFLTLTTLLLILSDNLSAQNPRTQSSGIYGLTELNLGYGLQGDVQPNDIGFAGLSALGGYWFTKSLTAGLGTGILAYNGSNAVPLYFEAGYFLREFGLGKMRIFLKADAGLLFRLNGNVDPLRVYVNPSVGLLIPISWQKDISVSLGYFTQYEQKLNVTDTPYQLTNFINAKIGLRFY
jgi:hypothetical protein